MRWWCLMAKPQEQRLARRKLTEAGYSVRALECQGEPLTAYLFIRTERPPTGAQYVEGVLRLLPSVSAPVALSGDDMAVLDEIERALNEAIRTNPRPSGPESTIAGMAKSMVANLLRSRFSRVTVQERVEPDAYPPRTGRSNHAHDMRRKAWA